MRATRMDIYIGVIMSVTEMVDKNEQVAIIPNGTGLA